jgi:hypothetical protein
MFESNRAVPANPVPGRLLMTGVAAALLTGCAQLTTPSPDMSDAQACSALKRVLAASGDDFRSLRESSGINDYDHTRWDAKPIAPGTECDIITWGGARTNYACTWDRGDETTARTDYESGLRLVRDCLGAGWQTETPAGQTGAATRFSRPGSHVMVDLRYSREREPSRNWQTSLTIGPPVTRDAR